MRAVRFVLLVTSVVVVARGLASAQTTPPPQGTPPVGQPQPPPQGYPPPPQGQEYQQPPQGYPPQQGYPQQQQGYPPPQQGYPPPQGYQQPQQYPPAYQPPPGYAPPPGYGQPGYGPPPPPHRSGFLALPYLGFTRHLGDTGTNLGTGVALGALLGGRLNPQFSLNGEISINFLSVKNLPPGEESTAVEIDFTFSPLFHAPISNTAEFVLGPKLGFFGAAEERRYNGASLGTLSANGLAAGFNAGMFFAVSPSTSLGGMMSFTIRDPSTSCFKAPGGAEQCEDIDATAEKVLGFNFGALF